MMVKVLDQTDQDLILAELHNRNNRLNAAINQIIEVLEGVMEQ